MRCARPAATGCPRGPCRAGAPIRTGRSRASTGATSTRAAAAEPSIDQRDLDAAARELAIAILSDPRHAAQVEAAAARHAEQAATLDSLIADAEQTALAMADRLGRGEITLARHDAVTGPLDARLADLRAKREALNGAPGPVPAAQSCAGWAARWENATHDERRTLLRTALRGRVLVVGPADPADRANVTRRVTIADPS